MAPNKTSNTPLSETVPSVPFSENIDPSMRDVDEAAAPIDKFSPQASTRDSQCFGSSSVFIYSERPSRGKSLGGGCGGKDVDQIT
jgi:hypothetical protein